MTDAGNIDEKARFSRAFFGQDFASPYGTGFYCFNSVCGRCRVPRCRTVARRERASSAQGRLERVLPGGIRHVTRTEAQSRLKPLLQELAGIEDSGGIKYPLYALHHPDLGRRAHPVQPRALQQPDAVLGRNAAADRLGQRIGFFADLV